MTTLSNTPAQLLQAVLQHGPLERPLLAPLCSAVAGELQGLPPGEVLYDVTKLSNGVRDLARSLNADVAVAEFGTLWDAEARGLGLDWSGGFPPRPRGLLAPAAQIDMAAPRATIVAESVRRLVALLPDRLVAAGVTGPARLIALSGGQLGLGDAVAMLLPALRMLCDAGAKLIWLVEGPEPPADLGALAAALQPVWQSIHFYQGIGVLHLAGAADGWRQLVAVGGPYLPCFDPDQSPLLAAQVRGAALPYGLALPPAAASVAARTLARGERCALLTNDDELAGRVPARDLRKVASALRGAIS